MIRTLEKRVAALERFKDKTCTLADLILRPEWCAGRQLEKGAMTMEDLLAASWEPSEGGAP